MEEANQVPVEQPEETGGSQKNQTKEHKEDLIPYSTYKKVLSEKKNTQSKIGEYETELKQLREEKLAREGKTDELLSSYKKELDQLRKEKDGLNKSYAWNTLTGEMKREAMKQGCTDPDKLIRLMDDEDLQSIEIGENFTINPESLKNVIEKNKKENHFLFQSSSKAVANGTPNNNRPIESNKNDLSKLTTEEIKELYKKQYK